MGQDILKEQLVQFLYGGMAFLPFKQIIENYPEDKINKKIPGVDYTPYQLMEHARIAQWDILEFMKDTSFQSPDWPEGYWPDKSKEATIEEWDASVKQFFTDLNEVETMIKDDQMDLLANLPDTEDYNYLREVLLIAHHNAYHVGQLMMFAKSE